MAQTPINSTAVLSPFIERAYGAGNATPQVDFDTLNTEFNTEKAAKKTEYQSLTQIGNTLDAARYAYIGQDINNLLDKAGKGEVIVGSPEWVAAVGDLTANAEQLSTASKVDAELTEKAINSPDKFRYFYQNENGDWLDGGIAKYKSDMLALKDQDFSSPQERVFAEAEIAKRANIAKRSIADGYKELATQAEQLNKELNSSADIESEVVKVTLGSEIIELTSQLDSSQTQAVVDMFVNQFADDLTWEYAQKDAKGEVPMKNGRKMTPQEYVTSQVKAFITQGDKKREIRSRPQPRNNNDSDGRLRDLGNGRFKSNDYMFEVINDATDRERNSIRGRRKGVGGRMTVTYTGKGETIKSFVDEDGDDILGKLTSIYVSNDGVITMNVLSGSNEENTVPFEKNAAKIEEFYGITKEEILSAIEGGDIKKAGTVIGGKSTESGAKNNKEEITW